jgi:hypothetical protein
MPVATNKQLIITSTALLNKEGVNKSQVRRNCAIYFIVGQECNNVYAFIIKDLTTVLCKVHYAKHKNHKIFNKKDAMKKPSLISRFKGSSRTNKLIAGGIALVVVVVGFVLIRTNAAGFLFATEAEQGAVSGTAEVLNDATASGGKAIIFKPAPVTPPPTTPPPTGSTMMGWQVTADNIGLKPLGLSCDSLPVYTGPENLAAGTTISGKRIEGRLNASKGNIVIEKSCIRPKSGSGPLIGASYLDGSNNRAPDGPITVRDSEINASLLSRADAANSDGVRGFPTTFQRNYVHSMGSGIAILLTGNSQNALIENNYVHKLTWDGGASSSESDDTHSDAFTIRDAAGTGRVITVKNNRFDCSGGHESGAAFLQTWLGPINNVSLEGNLLEGNNYNLTLSYLDYPFSGMKATNNRFNPFAGSYGPAATYGNGPASWAVWTDNYRYDASKPDAKGAAVAKP